MEGKGIIKFFLVVLTVVCLIQFLYFLPTNKVENAAESYAQGLTSSIQDPIEQNAAFKAAKTSYLDSMSNVEILSIPLVSNFTYQELKSKQLAFGLDLKGGMNVILQVDLREFIRTLANDSKDPTFLSALDNANAQLENSQSDFITLFGQEFSKLNSGKKLAQIFAVSSTLREDINATSSDGEVLLTLRDKANETVDQTFKLLKERIDKLGVVQPNVTLDEGRDIIVVELPGVDNPERAREFLQAAAKLEFWDVYRISDGNVMGAFVAADRALNVNGDEELSSPVDSVYEPILDDLGNVTGDSQLVAKPAGLNDFTGNGPLLSKLSLNQVVGGSILYPQAVFGQAQGNARKAIDEYLAKPEVKALFPRDIRFVWSKDPSQFVAEDAASSDLYDLYAIRVPNGGSGSAPLQGDKVTKASVSPDETGQMAISLSMNQKGAKIWGQMTSAAARDNQRPVAILLDDEVVSAPSVNQPIMDGNSSITGSFSTQEAQDLANILQIGKLPAKTKIIQESLVGPSLGKKNISRSVNSLAIGFAIVLIFMILYYGKSGIVSIIALFMNLFFIIGALSSWGTVLTLAGIAGIVLTIGMAVDANVIIYERIREELREGKTMRTAIVDGFMNSYSAIIDANVTTILTAMVLSFFGLGPIKGFAVVLIIGVICSLFTAVLLTRLMIEWWLGKDKEITFYTNTSKGAFSNLKIDWYGKRKTAYMVSGAIILLGIGSMFMRGFDLGVDFKGGYSYNIQFDNGVTVDADQLRTGLAGTFIEDGKESSLVVKAVAEANTYNIVTDYNIKSAAEDADKLALAKLHEGIQKIVGSSIDFKKFSNADGSGTHLISSTKVGPTIADDIMKSSFYATIFSLLLIFLYLMIRFTKSSFSMGAVAALFHDVLIVLSIFSIFHGWIGFSMEIDQNFIAAILTVIGYSINDTVVVFDRIREVMNTYVGKSKGEILNLAINNTVSRTVITSVTTLFVVLVLFLFGGASIKGFAFALVIGVVVGTYSSVFIASPIMADLSKDLNVDVKEKQAEGVKA